jgi:hypothetical protein
VDVFSWNGAYIAPNDWYSRVHLLAGDISLRPASKCVSPGGSAPAFRPGTPLFLDSDQRLPPYRISRPLYFLENFPQNRQNSRAFLFF